MKWISIILVLFACGDDGTGDRTDAGDDADAGGPIDSGQPDDAGPTDAGPEPCSPLGAMRTVPCGTMCGLTSQSCSAGGVWEPTGAGECLGEGECAGGAVEMETTPSCGERSRICDSATCSWSDWTVMRPDGECMMGETRITETVACPAGMGLRQTCTTLCTWDEGSCASLCGEDVRTSPPDAAEVCVPAGPFIRGSTEFGDTIPVREVFVSAFLIDRFPVTTERYLECVRAGACRMIPAPIVTPERARHPIGGVLKGDAEAFCNWDGGRRLPTSAEWEKAARGPAPDMRDYVWSSPSFRCDLVNGGPCGYRNPVTPLLPDPVDALPGTRSYWGTEMQVGGGYEWVSDFYSASYYSTEASLRDPTGPAGGPTLARGTLRDDTFEPSWFVSRLRPAPAGDFITVRCARSVTATAM